MAAAPNAIIRLTSAGVCSGPVNIYSNVDGFVTPFASNIPISTLTSLFGFLTTLPFGTTSIRVQNANKECSNYEQVIITL